MPDNLRTMPPRQHWRLAMYDENIAIIRKRIAEDAAEGDVRSREHHAVLLQGWMDLRAEFEAELAREEEVKRKLPEVAAHAS